MLRNITFLAASLCLSAPAFAYDSFEDLMMDIGRQQVEALKTYIADHPDADDIEAARRQLVYGYASMEQLDEALTILQEMYEALPEEKAGLDLSFAFGEVVVPIIQFHQMNGAKDEAKSFIKRVRKDFRDHEMYDAIDGAMTELAASLNKPDVGDAVDPIVFEALDGRKVDTEKLKGKVVLLDFWATWCAPCVQVMPEVVKLYEEFHDQGLEIIGISLDGEKKRLESFIKKNDIKWPQLFDGSGWENEIARRFSVDAIPTTYLIGPDGLIAAADPSIPELRKKVAELLAEK